MVSGVWRVEGGVWRVEGGEWWAGGGQGGRIRCHPDSWHASRTEPSRVQGL